LNWVDELNLKYKKNIFVDFLINVHPAHLAVGILPDDIRSKVEQQLIEYRNTKINKHSHELTVNSLNGIIGLLQKPRADDWQEQIARFKDYTNSLDVERNQSLRSISTELADLIDE
jgi:hypothetical protein